MTAGQLIARVIAERRRLLVPLAFVAVGNVALYGLIVYPLSLKVAASERRAAAARQQVQAAERDERAARATIDRAARADTDLQQFYTQTLPASVEASRRMTYARLAQLAAEHGIAIERRSYDVDTTYLGRLKKLKMGLSLSGEYSDIREFLRALERAPEFIVIENVALSESGARDVGLLVTVQLATYYAGGAGGA
jgi:Tfp pilus assembly protein PilO